MLLPENKTCPIRPGMVDDLRDALSHWTVEDVVIACDSLFIRERVLYSKDWQDYNLEQLLVYEGHGTLAADTLRYWFSAGPAGSKRMIYGTFLDWFINGILRRLLLSGGTWSVEAAIGFKIA